MKLLLPLLILSAVSLAPRPGHEVTLCGAEKGKGKPVGKCEPYAEVCRFCTDCTKCGHCKGKGGKCSVCWNK